MLLRMLVDAAAALCGPWAVWLIYAHLVRPFYGGAVAASMTAALSVAVGIYGCWHILSLCQRCREAYLLVGFIFYSLAVVGAQPIIGLFAVCTTGDCI